ncbi:hypothetical protein ATO00_11285 [Loigolactobacillus coryniformis subsp. coryniformis]|uniref:Uncharacterized protein n=1 Tax=Loigolactobacillus coryniformis subsp. coryniformis KCTC 3167 = DSM 20001 TaxID=913848 RepID=A0A0R1F7P0_9LACO|nr:hypothetical protein [Loigolactobacillus coryniformis]ATO55916.1 hypothetical protein LC20001_09870 [Loigolactobacillus coryniformis subsp. coryniformis KCTC 3167 = DSM 20001]KRK14727.1 hypothetical protein FD22_GL002150 [Loigolactobacillus coryniformis subsp. coryniformis KCTC 3167 = DSM 20001]OEH89404.1 hypothetical protein ATO00_11285 [Loigolactobacillus coryniformis subsp. coryniformis]
MANKFNISNGASGWSKQLNDFMNEYFGNDVTASSSGITFLNGVTSSDGIKYRLFSNKSGIAFAIFGSVSVPVSSLSKTGYETKLFNIPTNLPNFGETSQPWVAPSTGGQVRLSLAFSTNQVSIATMSGSTLDWANSASSSTKMWIDCAHIFPILN